MPAELLKIIVQAVVLERDEEGRIIGEQMMQPTVLYTPDHLAEFVTSIQTEIDAANNGVGPAAQGPPGPPENEEAP